MTTSKETPVTRLLTQEHNRVLHDLRDLVDDAQRFLDSVKSALDETKDAPIAETPICFESAFRANIERINRGATKYHGRCEGLRALLFAEHEYEKEAEPAPARSLQGDQS